MFDKVQQLLPVKLLDFIKHERHTCLIKSNNFTGKSCLVGGIFYCEDEFETIGFCQKDD